jgi:hypothetical protein
VISAETLSNICRNRAGSAPHLIAEVVPLRDRNPTDDAMNRDEQLDSSLPNDEFFVATNRGSLHVGA